MWEARTRDELIIEVWEKLDCDSVGRAEIEAVETALLDRFGDAALGSPMTIARLLADEGAVLRHSEIMKLFVERAESERFEAGYQNLRFGDLAATLSSLRQLESMREYFKAQNDRSGLRRVRERVLSARDELHLSKIGPELRSEVAEWIRVWVQTPDIFETWVSLRRKSPEFIQRFGDQRFMDED